MVTEDDSFRCTVCGQSGRYTPEGFLEGKGLRFDSVYDWGVWSEKETCRYIKDFEGEEPAVIGVTRDINKPRFVTAVGIIKARKKPLTIWSAEDIGIEVATAGLEGSPTKPGRLFEPEQGRAGETIGDTPETAAAEILQIIRKAGL